MNAHRSSLLSFIIALVLILSSCGSSSSDDSETSQTDTGLRYRMAFHIADDGWVYVFDNQYTEPRLFPFQLTRN